MLDDMRNLLIIIPSIIAIIGGVGKVSYNLFIESVKYQYKRVPAQQTNIGIIFNVALYIIIIIDILGIVLAFIGFMGASSESKIDMTNAPLAGILIIMIILSAFNFNKIRAKYIDKLNKNKYEKIGLLTFMSIIINIIFWGVLSIVLIIFFINIISERIAIKSNLGAWVFESSLTDTDYNGILLWGTTTVFCIIFFMISICLIEVGYLINKNINYYIIRKGNVISCECYLDYKEYYLVIDKGIERYIKKSDVIEIKKVKGNLNPNIKSKKRLKKRVKIKSRKFIKRNRRKTDV